MGFTERQLIHALRKTLQINERERERKKRMLRRVLRIEGSKHDLLFSISENRGTFI